MQLGQLEAALSDLHQAVAKQPDNFAALMAQAEVHDRMGSTQGAVSGTDTAHEIHCRMPTSPACPAQFFQQIAEN